MRRRSSHCARESCEAGTAGAKALRQGEEIDVRLGQVMEDRRFHPISLSEAPSRAGEVGVSSGSLGAPCPWSQCGRQGRALTSTLVMSQSLTALLWTPLVTIWKPLAVAVWSSTADGWGRSARVPRAPGPEPASLWPPHPGRQKFGLSPATCRSNSVTWSTT